MSKNILVLVGSPRNSGNSNILADAFIDGAKDSGNAVTKVNLGKYKISGCLDCKYCVDHDGKCAQRDGMDEIYPLIETADMIVLASPVYYFGFSAQIKAVIDRLYAKENVGNNVSQCALLTVAMDTDDSVFDPIVANYKAIISYLKWEDAGIIAVGGVGAAGDICENEGLGKAKLLGASIG